MFGIKNLNPFQKTAADKLVNLKIVINSENLRAVLYNLRKAVGRNTKATKPYIKEGVWLSDLKENFPLEDITKNIRVVADKNNVYFTATNGTDQVTQKMGKGFVNVNIPGNALIPFKQLSEILGSTKDEDIMITVRYEVENIRTGEIEKDEKGNEVKHENGGLVFCNIETVEIPFYITKVGKDLFLKDQKTLTAKTEFMVEVEGYHFDQFFTPMPPNKEYERCLAVSMNIQRVREIMKRCKNATSKDTSKQILTGISVMIGLKHIEFCGTDGLRLCRIISEKFAWENRKQKIEQRILSKEFCDIFLSFKHIKGDENDMFDIYFHPQYVVIISGNIRMCSRAIEGKYPDYNAIIPAAEDMRVLINCPREKLLKKMEDINNSFLEDMNPTEIYCGKDDKELSIQINQESKKYRSQIPVESRGIQHEFVTVVNSRLMAKSLTNFVGDKINIMTQQENLIGAENRDASVALLLYNKVEKGKEPNHMEMIMPIKTRR